MATILSAARAFHAAALLIESIASREIARSYDLAAQAVLAELDRLLAEYQRAVEVGETPTRAWLMRADRAMAILSSLALEGGIASQVALRAIRSAQIEMVTLAASSTREMLGLGGVRDVFSPPRAAFDQMIGFLGDGSPLSRLLDALPIQARDQARKALLQGSALGKNPREAARVMRQGVSDALAVPKSRALTISRTETMRAHREAGLENFKANKETVRGWVWLCACDVRSCASCWAMHGTFHDHREAFGSHPNCRCSPAPQVRGMPALVSPDRTGVARFASLSEEDQLEILGPRKFELFKAGRIGLEHCSVKTYDRNWGPQRHEATIAEAQSAAGQKRKAA